MANLASLQSALGHTFVTPDLLVQALTHRSHSAKHNERLEFLGDGVLNFAVASLLFHHFPQLDEGTLTRLRASLVRETTLVELATSLALTQHLRLGAGEMKSGGFRRPSILADTLEALLGAVYLDAGFDAAAQLIARLYRERLATLDPHTQGKDAKTSLQEWLQARKLDLPTYHVTSTHGAAHAQTFDLVCRIPALGVEVSATGASRKIAEQAAARLALRAIESEPSRARKSRARATPWTPPDTVAQKAV